MIQKAFTIGNSTAITIPKKTGIKPGTKLKFKSRTKSEITYEIIDEIDNPVTQTIRDTSGGFDIDIKNLEEKINKLRYDQYDKEIRFS